jgi:hypothetical protein
MAHRFGIYRDHISEIENGKKNVCPIGAGSARAGIQDDPGGIDEGSVRANRTVADI